MYFYHKLVHVQEQISEALANLCNSVCGTKFDNTVSVRVNITWMYVENKYCDATLLQTPCSQPLRHECPLLFDNYYYNCMRREKKNTANTGNGAKHVIFFIKFYKTCAKIVIRWC